MGGFRFITLFVLRALMSLASAAISFSLTSVKGAGTRLSFLGGDEVATVEREWEVEVGEGERVLGDDEKRVTVAVALLSWDS